MRKPFYVTAILSGMAALLIASFGYRPQQLQDFNTEKLELDSTILDVTTIAENLNVPWEMTWGPDNTIWFTDHDGKVSKIDPKTGQITELLQIKDYYRKRLGLMSMVLHPDWKTNPQVFINYTHIRPDSVIISKLVRYTYNGQALIDPVLLKQIPGYLGHNGSRLVISRDRKLLWATGDLKQKETIHNPAFANGKVLRLNLDGTIPNDNPHPGSPAWAMGFRVPQGLAYTKKGNLFIAEHGDATDDEVNRVVKGGNYGWPYIAGFSDMPQEKNYSENHKSIFPAKAWTPTIAPAGMEYYDGNIPEWKNALLLSTLKDQSLRVLKLDKKQEKVIGEDILFRQKFGRLRDVCVSPSGDVYISTSNRDWNPPANFPVKTDDRIIRISKSGIIPKDKRTAKTKQKADKQSAAALFASFCESCHKADGQGVQGSFPSLVTSSKLAGANNVLIPFLLKGSQSASGEGMPGFGFLPDEQLSEIVSYARLKFSTNINAISASEISMLRVKN
ncbi:PQQ-dependent sugar dehydrogenase [Dyadobacter chenwenxiniae]|uniref:PQQ-dependent sugar dehydrogenase n=1 Tax=Dyadobacter chenwenxiniae TaxID=2906456 RepID=A0A9X1PFG6_9BACT|nr:PQQ-dependent sugar dehydrogenase [Dyadobacter chenwenxiniae]MCF0060240.1 PQQ-dependent sugar dehydrogenase [Dyadobacter chenwenxiniae]UON85978.1 PQQ-dependent sugar dehydrogenase [Dyadobacter chenwenxiniae]